MKKIYLFLFVIMASFQMNAQCYSYNVSQGAGPQYFHDGLDIYAPNTECSGTFTNLDGSGMVFIMESLDLEADFDYLRFYDGPDSSYPMIANMTGGTEITFASTSSTVFFTFSSDFSNEYSGWSGWASSACYSYIVPAGGSVPFNDGMDIYSPNMNCGGIFINYGGDGIEFDFSSVEIESSWDFLTFYDGPNTSAPVIYSWSGTEAPTFTSTSSMVYFTFTSDGSNEYSGWSGVAYDTQASNVNESSSDVKVKLYPNPSDGMMNLDLPAVNASFQLEIYDLAGKMLHTQKVVSTPAKSTMSLDMTSLAGGQYLLVLSNNDMHITSPFSIR